MGRTYLNTRGKYVSEEPDVYQIGIDKIGRKIYTDSILYMTDRVFSEPFHFCNKFNWYKYIINNCVVIEKNEYNTFMKYFYAITFGNNWRKSLHKIPKVGSHVTREWDKNEYIVEDVSPVLFIKIRSLDNKYSCYEKIYNLQKHITIKDIRRKKLKKIQKNISDKT